MFRKIIFFIYNFLDNLIYFILYYLFYLFGSKNKNIFYRILRSYEKYKLKIFIKKNKLSLNKLSKECPLMYVTPDNKKNKKVFGRLTNNKKEPLVIKELIKDSIACKKWSPKNVCEYTIPFNGPINISQISKDCHHTSSDLQDTNNNNIVYTSKRNSENLIKLLNKNSLSIKDLELNNISKIDDHFNETSYSTINLLTEIRNNNFLNCTGYGNYFLNIYGRKKYILIDPIYSRYLKSIPSKKFKLVISEYNIEIFIESGKFNNIIPKYEIILEPGDVLYLPPWWWYYANDESMFTINCIIKNNTTYWQGFRNNLLFMLFSPYIYQLNPFFLKIINFFKKKKAIIDKIFTLEK